MRKAYLIPLLVVAFGFSMLSLPRTAEAQVSVGISVRIGPPPLPVYAQPICPGPDYIWTPGYWAWGPGGYFWVPGTWVLAPEPGLLWTPGWWGFAGGVYVWHPGYWGRHVGFYGGINYGFGYFGVGYVGGEWRGGHFFYNRAVSHVNVTVVRNVYVNRSYRRVTTSRVAYNGGRHGVNARPNPEQRRWGREQHFARTAEQNRHMSEARTNRALRYSNNHGRPPVAATQRPSRFSGPGVVRPRQPRNQARPQTNENRARPNRGQEQRNYAEPRNERGGRPEAWPRNERGPRGSGARPRNEQQRGNQGGKRGNGRRRDGHGRQ